MKHIINFSGGRTSAYMAQLVKDKYPNAESIFMDTGAEHPNTYEFIRQCDKHFNLNLKVIKPVVNPEMGKGMSHVVLSTDEMGWDLSTMTSLVKKYGSFSHAQPLCTTMLKTRTASSYLKKYKDEDVNQWIGIRVDEKRRLRDKKGFSYLADISDFDKQDVLSWWKEQPFDLDLMEHLGNCVFCVKKTPSRVALAQRDEPELFNEWNAMVKSARKRTEHDKEVIYRNFLSPDGIVNFYKDHSYEDIKQTMRMYKNKQTVCSESCEAYQMELFDE